MGNKKKFNKTSNIIFKIDEDVKIKLQNKVGNISEFLRKYIYNYLETADDDMTMLNQNIEQKRQKKQSLEVEIKLDEKRLKDLEEERELNINNQQLFDMAIETIYGMIKARGGVTDSDITQIANIKKIPPHELKIKCQELGIKPIPESKQIEVSSNLTIYDGKVPTSTIIKEEQKEVSYEEKLNKMMASFKRRHNSFLRTSLSKKTEIEFLDTDRSTYEEMCKKRGVKFEDFYAQLKK